MAIAYGSRGLLGCISKILNGEFFRGTNI